MLEKLADDAAGADVDLRLAAIAFHTHEYREALDIWERYPDVTEARLGVTLCMVELKRYEDARPRLLALYELIPADARLLDALRGEGVRGRGGEVGRPAHDAAGGGGQLSRGGGVVPREARGGAHREDEAGCGSRGAARGGADARGTARVRGADPGALSGGPARA